MYMPVPVFSETDAVLKHSKKIAGFGKKALIITGKSSAKINGSLDDIRNVLNGEGIDFIIFNDIEENPSVETVMKAKAIGLSNNVDFVIGIGGGSPLDAAKAAAFMLAHPKDSAELLYRTSDDTALPLVLIPTTCGTGSEVTPISVLTRHEFRTKKSISHKIFADIALIDGKYLCSAPVNVLRNTALDALTHLIESCINIKTDDFSRMFVEQGLKLWSKNKDVLETGNASDEQLQEMMNASAMAGMAIAQNGTGIPHGLSYSLTYKLHVPHGRAVGYFTAGYLNEAMSFPSSENSCGRYILDTIGFGSIYEFAEWYKKLYGTVQADDEILSEAVNELWSNKPKLHTAPFNISYESLRRIAFFTKDVSGTLSV